MEISKLTIETFQSSETDHLKKLNDYKNWCDIPLLNYTPLHELKDSSLVRFRGMIQDMFNPEIYLEQYEVYELQNEQSSLPKFFGTVKSNCRRLQSGKYRDCYILKSNESVDYNSSLNMYGERRTLFVVSIPGFNKWAFDCENDQNNKSLQDNYKNLSKSSSSDRGQKQMNEEKMGIDVPFTDSSNRSRRIRTLKTEICNGSSNQILSFQYLFNSPITERRNKECMVKVYSNFDDFSLNSIVEFVGFLSIDPHLDGFTRVEENDFMEVIDTQATNLSPSLIPRLHTIAFKNLVHTNPLLDIALINDATTNLNAETIHNDLKIVLTQCLFGDDVAADYLVSHLISKVYVRTDFQTLGQLTLNISNIPSQVLPEYIEKFYEIIESLLPASYYFPMSLDNMNTVQFIPKQDYKANRLTNGLLQLAPHTHLVLDETRLQSGKLEANGVFGIQNLSHLIKSQQIKCNFEFYEIDYNVDIPVLILSEGKSMLPSDFHIPLHIFDEGNIELIMETLKAAKHYLQSKLHDIRKYLTKSKIQNFNMNPNDLKMVENDFVEMRKANNQVGPDELHSLLVLSRSIGVAMGKEVLDQQSWDIAKHMEETRRKRIERNLHRRRNE